MSGRQPPSCPRCNGRMVVRTATGGPQKGRRFWSCSRYPECKGVLKYEGEPSAKSGRSTPTFYPPQSKRPRDMPVDWSEQTDTPRPDYVAEYSDAGALPGVVHEALRSDPRLPAVLGQFQLLSLRTRNREATRDTGLIAGLLLKMLRRGRLPLVTLGVEGHALNGYELANAVREFMDGDAEVGWTADQQSKKLRVSTKSILAAAVQRSPFDPDPAFEFAPGAPRQLVDSEAEERFLKSWVPEALGPSAGHWFTPQAPLDKLVESAAWEAGGAARRVDLLFSHPGGDPFVVELDGPEHDPRGDRARDNELALANIDVIRVTNDEVTAGHGPALERIKDRCLAAMGAFGDVPEEHRAASDLVLNCADAPKIQYAVGRAVQFGWLTGGGIWNIEIKGAAAVGAAAVRDSLILLSCIDALYRTNSTPETCTVHTEEAEPSVWRRANGNWTETDEPHSGSEQPDGRIDRLTIAVEQRSSPFAAVRYEEKPDFVIRPAYLPVPLAQAPPPKQKRRPAAEQSYENAKRPLTRLLRQIFRKRDFRPFQGEAVFNALRGNDAVVLLPTGAGKSIIYQLAGLLMPGLTVVVDPINALIEDQLETLRKYGIDRTDGITKDIQPAEQRRLLRRIARGQYFFIFNSPERLQTPRFRAALRELAQTSLVNLAVIDEAHCVSEWGHQFRPAYLHLGKNLRELAQGDTDGGPPPILALTGTASRAVLRDMLTDLKIDRGRSDALLRPTSFDRPELRHRIVRTSPRENPTAALQGVMQTLPGEFGLPPGDFYRPAGAHTQAGIVFVQNVNGAVYGVLAVKEHVQNATMAPVTLYSGKAPKQDDDPNQRDWGERKRENARNFKENRAPVLVATKAFGMGIDKPNIRYTVHFGMPPSIEAYYQEAGRAGRDGRTAHSVVVFSEHDRARSDRLMDQNITVEELRERYAQTANSTRARDDITRGLWFHLNAFKGPDAEVAAVKDLIETLGDLSGGLHKEVPFARRNEKHDPDKQSRESNEKALYQLLKLGVIRDYEADYGAKKFVVYADAFDLERYRDNLIDYVRATTAGRTDAFATKAEKVSETGPDGRTGAIVALARMLIEFTYDVIERSRRRAILESVLLARDATDGDDVRRRILDYLHEGLGAQYIDELLEEETVDLTAWWELAAKAKTRMEAGELRGLCIRALESQPDHPGLLLTRAVAEAMCSDHDHAVTREGIRAGLGTALFKYELPEADILAGVHGLFDIAEGRLHAKADGAGKGAENGDGSGSPVQPEVFKELVAGLRPVLTMGILDFADQTPEGAFLKSAARQRAAGLNDPSTAAVLAANYAQHAVDELHSAVRRILTDRPAIAPAASSQ